jgi:hypothetical protein
VTAARTMPPSEPVAGLRLVEASREDGCTWSLDPDPPGATPPAADASVAGSRGCDGPLPDKGAGTRPERLFRTFDTFVLRRTLPFVLCGLIAVTLGHLVGLVSDSYFRKILSDGLNGVLLVIIFAELRQTLRDAHSDARSAWSNLVRDFLVIVVLSSVRHILTAGAEISLLRGTNATEEIRLQLGSIAVNGRVIVELCFAILIVTFAQRLADRSTRP